MLFVRSEPLPIPRGASSVVMSPLHRNLPSGSIQSPLPPAAPPSGIVATPSPRQSGFVTTPAPRIVEDPHTRLKQRVTERIIAKCAAAGVYDLSAIPSGELQRVIHAHVLELSMLDRVAVDETAKERMVLEILAKMNR